MFRLFSKQRKYSHLNEKQRNAIDNTLLWFINVLGFKKGKDSPFVYAHTPDFKLAITGNLAYEFAIICERCKVDSALITLAIFDDLSTKTWQFWELNKNEDGSYSLESTDENKQQVYRVDLFQSTLKEPYWTIYILSYQLAGISLLQNEILTRENVEFLLFSALAQIYFGYGIFAVNCLDRLPLQKWDFAEIGLTYDQYIYTVAVMAYCTSTDYKLLLPHFTHQIGFNVNYECEILFTHEETKLTRDAVERNNRGFELISSIDECITNRDFKRAIALELERLEIIPKDKYVLNRVGYFHLYLKQYEQAIQWFDQAIEVDPFLDILFNNRAYCYLMLGKYTNAKTDLHTTVTLNEKNAYAWRNKAIYSMIHAEWTHVLEWLDKAYELDNKVELINFYRSIAHNNLNNEDQAKHYRKLSEELNEFNDSIFDFHTIFIPQSE